MNAFPELQKTVKNLNVDVNSAGKFFSFSF